MISVVRNKILLASISSLILGTTIYLLFRTSTLKVFKWLKIFEIDFVNSNLRRSSISYFAYLPKWMLFSLPDGLWIFSYVCAMVYIWNFKIHLQSICWIAIIPCIAIASEIGQATDLVPGTFDPLDLFFYFSGLTSPLLLIFKNKNLQTLKL